MDFKTISCPVCGATEKHKKTEINGEVFWHCIHCDTDFSEESSIREYERLESYIKQGMGAVIEEALLREKTEKIYNLRSELCKKARAKYIDSAAICRICADIKKIAPQEFLAEFFEITNSAEAERVAEYLQNVDVEDNVPFLDMVFNFLIASLKEEYITPVAFLLERAGSVLTTEKHQNYLTRFEKEAKKVQSGIYEVGIERDVFLAYSSKDMKNVLEILNVIEANGLTCFAAFRNMQHGRDAVANYEKLICKAIDNCKIFLFISSKNSRHYSCDALKLEIDYIKKKETDRFPEYRSYEQIPYGYKKLRVEYRLDNKPTKVVEKQLKSFFSGLTYIETPDKLIERLGVCIEEFYSASANLKEKKSDLTVEEAAVENLVYAEKNFDDKFEVNNFTDVEGDNSVSESDQNITVQVNEIPEEESREELKLNCAPEVRTGDGDKYNIQSKEIVWFRDFFDLVSFGNYAYLTKGTVTYENGDVYLGSVRKKYGYISPYKKQGLGKYSWSSGEVCEGKFKKDKIDGKAKIRFTDGDIYEGRFKEGIFQGRGKYKWANGTVFSGGFSSNEFKLRCRAKIMYPNGDVYRGGFEFGRRSGRGRLDFVNDGNVYVGAFENDKPNGKGKYKWADGSVYIGEFSNGIRSGYGKYISSDGYVYKGEWKDDKPCGHGTLKTLGGFVYKGKFIDGALSGEAVVTLSNGERVVREYDNGNSVRTIKSLKSPFQFLNRFNLKRYTKYDNAYYIGNETNPFFTLVKARNKRITSCVIHKDTEFISQRAFWLCKNISSITIPSGVKTIESYTFHGCTNLKRVIIPDSVTDIESNAFDGCSALVSVRIPEGVTKICSSTFNGCTNLKSVIIPDSVTRIGKHAFTNCSSLGSITIPDSVTDIESNVFAGCSALESVRIPEGVTKICSSTFQGCTNLKSVIIPDSVTRIGDHAFSNCSSLGRVTIPDSVTDIGSYAFANCSDLITVLLPDSVKMIGDNAFYACSNLESVNIPNGLTKINDYTFDNSSICTITIPDSVLYIGFHAFSDTLKKVNYAGTETNWRKIEKSNYWCNYSSYRITYGYKE